MGSFALRIVVATCFSITCFSAAMAEKAELTIQAVDGRSHAIVVGDTTIRIEVGGNPAEPDRNASGTALYRLSRLGGTCSKLIETPTSCAGSPDLSRDGTKVAFDGWQKHLGETVKNAHVYTFELSQPRHVEKVDYGAMPSWSSDGEQISLAEQSGYKVSLLNLKSEDRRLLDGTGWSAEWSPDGSKIAYIKNHSGGQNLVIHDVETERNRRLFHSRDLSFIKWGITWSPDSKRLCFYGRSRRLGPVLAIVHVEGEDRERRIISSKVPQALMAHIETPVAWGGDGTHVLFSSREDPTQPEQLYSLSVSGDAPPSKVQGLPAGIHCDQPYWHPDGTILFVGTPVRSVVVGTSVSAVPEVTGSVESSEVFGTAPIRE